MNTIGESISRVRNVVKGLKEDAFITDRLIYSLIIKYAKLLIKRSERAAQMTGFNSFFRTLPCVDLVEIDTVAECCGVSSGIKIKRTVEKVPKLLEGNSGPLLRLVASIDGSTLATRTTLATYASISKQSSFKYNKAIYYWLNNDYIYIPVDWDSIMVEGMFEDDISDYLCDNGNKCTLRQDQELQIPDYLLAEVEDLVIKNFTISAQMPPDNATDDKQNILR